MSTNPYDALRKVINHEANQHDDGGFFAQLGGIEPDNDDDGPTARGLFQHVDYTRLKAAQEYLNANTSWDNWYDPPLRSDSLNPHDHTDVTQYIQRRYGPAVKWPPRIDFARNSYVYQYDPKVMPKKTWLDHMIDAFKPSFKPQPKRQPITQVRRISRRPNPITGRTFSTWYWQCALCDHNMKPRETGSTHYGELCHTWTDAYRRANHHAHNHHGK